MRMSRAVIISLLVSLSPEAADTWAADDANEEEGVHGAEDAPRKEL